MAAGRIAWGLAACLPLALVLLAGRCASGTAFGAEPLGAGADVAADLGWPLQQDANGSANTSLNTENGTTQAGARRLNKVYRLACTVSRTGANALPTQVLDMLETTVEKLRERTAPTIDQLFIYMLDDESNVTRMQNLYEGFCLSYPSIDVLLGPVNASWNLMAVEIAKRHQKPIIVWTFNQEWYDLGPGYFVPPNLGDLAPYVDSISSMVTATRPAGFDSVSWHARREAYLISAWVLEGEHFIDTTRVRGNPEAQTAREAMDAVTAGMSREERLGYLHSTTDVPAYMAFVEMALFGWVTSEQAEYLHETYRDCVGRTTSHAEFNAEMLHKLSALPSFQHALNGDIWASGYERVFDINIPLKDTLYHTLATLYEEGSRTVVFVTTADRTDFDTEGWQFFVGGINCAKSLNYTGVYAELYQASRKQLWSDTIGWLKPDVVVMSGNLNTMLACIASVEFEAWGSHMISVVIAHHALFTRLGISITSVLHWGTTHFYIQPMPWPALGPGNPSLIFYDMGVFLHEVFPSLNYSTVGGDTQMLYSWQLSSAFTVFYAALTSLSDELDGELMRDALCEKGRRGEMIYTEMGPVRFNCSSGGGMRIDRTSSTRQLLPLPTTYAASQRFTMSQALYISRELPRDSVLRVESSQWWNQYSRWYQSATSPRKSAIMKHLDIWPCGIGQELILGSYFLTSDSCVTCRPGTYFHEQWLRCLPCPKPSWRIIAGASICLDLPVTDPTGGAVYDTSSTVPRATPGWYRLTNDTNEETHFIECPDPSHCTGNNTCLGHIVGTVCDSCSPGWQKWATFTGELNGLAEGLCHSCDNIYPNARLFLLATSWTAIAFILARLSNRDTWKVCAIRAAVVRMCIVKLQYAGISLSLVQYETALSFFVAEVMVSPWDLLALECQAQKLWPGGTHEEWREFVLMARVYVVLCIFAIGVMLIFTLGGITMLGKIPADGWRRFGPHHVILFFITGKMWKMPAVSKQDQDELAKMWGMIDTSNSDNAFLDIDVQESRSELVEESPHLGFTRVNSNAQDDDGEDWPPPMHRDADFEQLIIMHALNDLMNERSRWFQDSQRRTISFFIVMNPLVITSVLGHFTCTSTLGTPFRLVFESDLMCVASRVLESKKLWLLGFPFAMLFLMVWPLVANRARQGDAVMHTKNRRATSVLITGYKSKWSWWQIWEHLRLWMFSFVAYNVGDAPVVATRRLGFIIASAVVVCIVDPYVKTHKHALFSLDLLWHVFLGHQLSMSKGVLDILFPDLGWFASVMTTLESAFVIVLVITQLWLLSITTWDPNRYNIDNLSSEYHMSWLQRSYLWLFRQVAGINAVVIGQGLAPAKYVDLRKINRLQTHYLAHILADVLLECLEFQPTFCPTVCGVILDEAFRRAAAGREALIESRAIRHQRHWEGPFRKEFCFRLAWLPDPSELQRALQRKIKKLGQKLLDDKVCSPEELTAYLDTHIVVRDPVGKIIHTGLSSLPRESFPLEIRVEMNRSIGVEELATALADVSQDFLEGEPIINSHITSLVETGEQHSQEAVDEIMNHLKAQKAAANLAREVKKKSDFVIRALFKGHHHDEHAKRQDVYHWSPGELVADASRVGNRAYGWMNTLVHHDDQHAQQPTSEQDKPKTPEQRRDEAIRDALQQKQKSQAALAKKQTMERDLNAQVQAVRSLERAGTTTQNLVVNEAEAKVLADMMVSRCVESLKLDGEQASFMTQELEGAFARASAVQERQNSQNSVWARCPEYTEEYTFHEGPPGPGEPSVAPSVTSEVEDLSRDNSMDFGVGICVSRTAAMKHRKRDGLRFDLQSKLGTLELLLDEYRKRGMGDSPGTIKKCYTLIDRHRGRCSLERSLSDTQRSNSQDVFASLPRDSFSKASSPGHRAKELDAGFQPNPRAKAAKEGPQPTLRAKTSKGDVPGSSSDPTVQRGTPKLVLSFVQGAEPPPLSPHREGEISAWLQRKSPVATPIGAPFEDIDSTAACVAALREDLADSSQHDSAHVAGRGDGAGFSHGQEYSGASSSTAHGSDAGLDGNSSSVDLSATVVGLQLPASALVPTVRKEVVSDLPLSALAPAGTTGLWAKRKSGSSKA